MKAPSIGNGALTKSMTFTKAEASESPSPGIWLSGEEALSRLVEAAIQMT